MRANSCFLLTMVQHACPWKVRQWPDWDAVAEMGSLTVKFFRVGIENKQIKIMESFRLKMEEDSLAIITSPVSVFHSLPPFLYFSFCLVFSIISMQTPSPFSLAVLCFYFSLQLLMWQHGNRTCIKSSIQLGFLFSCWGTALNIKRSEYARMLRP